MTLTWAEGTGGSVAEASANATWAWSNAGLSILADDIVVLVFAGIDDGSGYGVSMFDSVPPDDFGSDAFVDIDTAQMRIGTSVNHNVGLQIWQVRASTSYSAGSVSGDAFWRQDASSSTAAPAWGWWKIYRIRGLGPTDTLELLSVGGFGSLASPGDSPGEFARDLLSRTADSLAMAWAMAFKSEHAEPPVGFTGLAEGDAESFVSFDDEFTTLSSPPLATGFGWAIGFARGELDAADTDAIFHANNSGGGTTWAGTKWCELLLEFSALVEAKHGLSTYIGIKFPEAPT